MGDLTPALPKPRKQHSKAFTAILITVVAVVATVYGAGIFAPELVTASGGIFGAGTAALAGGNLAAAAAGGALGSVAAQGAGIALGVQDGFSFSQVALGALGAAAGAGISAGVGLGGAVKAGAAELFARGSLQGALNGVAQNGFGAILDPQSHFSWTSVAAGAITAGIGAAVSGIETVNRYRKIQDGLSFGAGIASRTAENFAYGSVNRLVTVALQGHGKVDVASIAADAFGNALGNSIVGAMRPKPSAAASGGSIQTTAQGDDWDVVPGAPTSVGSEGPIYDMGELPPMTVTASRAEIEAARAAGDGGDYWDRSFQNLTRWSDSIGRQNDRNAARQGDIQQRQALVASHQVQPWQQSAAFDNGITNGMAMGYTATDPTLGRLDGQDFASKSNWGAGVLRDDELQAFADIPAMAALALAFPLEGLALGAEGLIAGASALGRFGVGVGQELSYAGYALSRFNPVAASSLIVGNSPRLAALGALGVGSIEGAPMDGTLDGLGVASRRLARSVGDLDMRLASSLPGLTTVGMPIPLYYERTTTVLGTYAEDTQRILATFHTAQTEGLVAPRLNSINLLDVNTPLRGREFWTEYNRPFLDQAISRDDVFFMATAPLRDETMNMRALTRVNLATGRLELSGFGREYRTLRQNGYVYDPITSQMVRK